MARVASRRRDRVVMAIAPGVTSTRGAALVEVLRVALAALADLEPDEQDAIVTKRRAELDRLIEAYACDAVAALDAPNLGFQAARPGPAPRHPDPDPRRARGCDEPPRRDA